MDKLLTTMLGGTITTPGRLHGVFHAHPPWPIQCVGVSLLLALLTSLYIPMSSPRKIPDMNPMGFLRLSKKKAVQLYLTNARGLVEDWFSRNPDTPARLNTQIGPVVVLPASMADETANDERFHLRQQTAKTFNAHLPGFEVFRDDYNNQLMKTVVSKHLNKQLAKVTGVLAEEMSLGLSEHFTDSTEWHHLPLHATALQLVAQLSARVFLGEELGRDREWLRITAGYAGIVTMAFADLSRWSSWMRSTANRFLPRCKASREYVDGVRKMLGPVIADRRRERLDATARGVSPPEYNDAIEWFELESGGKAYDPEIVQLSLSLAAVHTAGDLLAQTLAEVAVHPEIIEPLRQEMTTILAKGGWQKASLDKMKLLDSVIKESQRMKPLATVSMGRIAVTDAKLSDGTVIPRGTTTTVDAGRMWDPAIHDRPDEWDAYRFYNRRKESGEKQRLAELTTTAPEHLAFGHGMYACPGRFFAANEVKIALVSILLKYDIKFEDGVEPNIMRHGITMDPDRRVKLSVRGRERAAL